MMNAILISFGLSQNMWGETILSNNYFLNKVPQNKKKTSYEFWKGRRPFYKYLRLWGCFAKVVVKMVVIVAITTPKKMKIDPKMVDCIFIGYAHNSNAYRFLVYESENPDIHKTL